MSATHNPSSTSTEPVPSTSTQPTLATSTEPVLSSSPAPDVDPPASVLVDRALAFLSTASPETLIAGFVAVTAVLYVCLGSLGMLIVGIAVGVLIHASLSLVHAKKDGAPWSEGLHEWLERRRIVGEAEMKVTTRLDFAGLPPETAKALEELTDAAVRDYVRWWYNPILPTDDNFPTSCRNQLVRTLLAMHAHISHKRPAETFMVFLISTATTSIVFLRELAQASRSSVGTYVEESPSSALAQMIDKEQQRKRLKLAANDFVQKFFGKDALQCEPVRTFFTEIIAGVALEMTVDKFAALDCLNSWIIYLLEEETQPEILQKIDIGEATAAAGTATTTTTTISNDEVKVKRVGAAEEEMDKAMEEAQKMNQMIAADEERRSMETAKTRGSEENRSRQQRTGSVNSTASGSAFTSFDQIVKHSHETLHGAHIEVMDLTQPSNSNDRTLRSKPTSATYLLQIEPASSLVTGWLVTRKYTDFESLHEVLRRISAISGAENFRRHHTEMPNWRGETMSSLRGLLERYLNDALDERELAESEGMRRFLDKDSGIATAKGGNAFAALGKGLNASAFAKVGQGALDVLSKAPQGVADGGKGFFGGMKKAFTVGQREDGSSITPPAMSRATSNNRTTINTRSSVDRGDFSDLTTDYYMPQLEQSPVSRTNVNHNAPYSESVGETTHRRSETSSSSIIQLEIPSIDNTRSNSVVSLPPPPSDMPDDFSPMNTQQFAPRTQSVHSAHSVSDEPPRSPTPPAESKIENQTSTAPTTSITSATSATSTPAAPAGPTTSKPPTIPPSLTASPLTTEETQWIIEILFDVLNELYTLSSAWTIRRSFLNVAKSLLLRPGNPTLETIRTLLQSSVIDANTSDAAIAALIRKLRYNVFPTDLERQAWEGEEGGEGDELREKARRLWCERAVPQALRGVMGMGTTEEALGAVFDALQMQGVARGVVANLVLEACRGVCQ